MQYQCTYVTEGNGIAEWCHCTIKRIAIKMRCLIQEVVYWNYVTSKDNETMSSVSTNGIYQYELRVKDVDVCHVMWGSFAGMIDHPSWKMTKVVYHPRVNRGLFCFLEQNLTVHLQSKYLKVKMITLKMTVIQWVEMEKTWWMSAPHFYKGVPTRNRGCPRGVMVKVMHCGIVVCEFVLQSRCYVHFRANTLGKGMNPLILPPAMGK